MNKKSDENKTDLLEKVTTRRFLTLLDVLELAGEEQLTTGRIPKLFVDRMARLNAAASDINTSGGGQAKDEGKAGDVGSVNDESPNDNGENPHDGGRASGV